MISARTFTQQLLDAGVQADDILDATHTLEHLLKHYGKNIITNPSIMTIINKEQPVAGELLVLLQKYKRIRIPYIISMAKHTKNLTNHYTKHFQVKLPQGYKTDQLSSHLQKTFGKDTMTHETDRDDIAVTIKGEGYGYRKSLDHDLQTMLE